MRTEQTIKQEIATLQEELKNLPKEIVLHSGGGYGTITLTPTGGGGLEVSARRDGQYIWIGHFNADEFHNLEV